MKTLLASIVVAAVLLASAHSAQAEPIAIAVNKTNDTDELTMKALARIFRGDHRKWSDGQRILVLNRPIDSEMRSQFYRIVLGSKPTEKFFEPGSPVPFKTMLVRSSKGIRRFVARIPNAIGYLRLSEVDETMKVLKIDGKLPNEDGYIIARRGSALRLEDSLKAKLDSRLVISAGNVFINEMVITPR